jgi:CBS domain-containing protein
MVRPDQSIVDAAKMMAQSDCGVLPVQDGDRLIGMITDRDIVTRAVAKGRDGQCHVQDVMTKDVKYCFDDEDLSEVAHNMADIQVRRLAVLNRDKRLVGILSLGDIANRDGTQAAEALCGVSEHASRHASMGSRPH